MTAARAAIARAARLAANAASAAWRRAKDASGRALAFVVRWKLEVVTRVSDEPEVVLMVTDLWRGERRTGAFPLAAAGELAARLRAHLGRDGDVELVAVGRRAFSAPAPVCRELYLELDRLAGVSARVAESCEHALANGYELLDWTSVEMADDIGNYDPQFGALGKEELAAHVALWRRGRGDVSGEKLGDARLRKIDLTPINVLLKRVLDQYQPEQVWLFGSWARGDARPCSDWDLFVVLPDNASEQQLDPVQAFRLQRGSGVYADVVPCRASDFRSSRGVINTLCHAVATEGVLIYERCPTASGGGR